MFYLRLKGSGDVKDSEGVLEEALAEEDGPCDELLCGVLRGGPRGDPALHGVDGGGLLHGVPAEVEREGVDPLHLRTLALALLGLREDEAEVALGEIGTVEKNVPLKLNGGFKK